MEAIAVIVVILGWLVWWGIKIGVVLLGIYLAIVFWPITLILIAVLFVFGVI